MTREEAAEIIQSVCQGASGHNSGYLTKSGKEYEIYTSIDIGGINAPKDALYFEHFCNKMSLQEARDMIDGWETERMR